MYFKRYDFGETAVYFVETPVEGHAKKTTVGLAVYPADVAVDPAALHCDSLVQVAFTGDETLADYTYGVTMRNRSATLLKIVRQTQFMGGTLNTYLTDGAGNDYVHRLSYDRATGVFTCCVRYENHSGSARALEHLSSFSLSGIASPAAEFTARGLTLHRLTSAWSRECRPMSDTFAHLGLEMSWARYGVKTEKWGELGGMANRGYYPFAAVESEDGLIWGATLEAPFSWQMEVYLEKETCALSGGLADYESGHWRKVIPAGGSFTTRNARFTVKRGSLLDVSNAFVREQDLRLSVPASEEEMPILFNEYCTTWGCPSERNVTRILKALKTLPVRYFVIDCGWYKPDGKGWCNAVGDWKESGKLFPEGIKKVADKIKAAGMRPGIWFEYEVAGRDSESFSHTEWLLKRDARVITAKNRRFFDLRLPEVQRYLKDRVLRFLRENGFGYLKIDYNDTFGFGCDSADGTPSGEGGRQVAEESVAFLGQLKEGINDLVIENCSSGGSRIEPLRMGMVSMCSFSDAHECPEIPLVAANVTRVVPARQVQIWAVIRENEPDFRTVYSLCAAMMGRICLSGDIQKVSPEKLALIGEGLAFYQSVKEIVRYGEIRAIDCDVLSYRAPKGRQVYLKDYGKSRLVLVHFLDSDSAVRLALGDYEVAGAYTDLPYTVRGDVLRIAGQPFHAAALLLRKREEGQEETP